MNVDLLDSSVLIQFLRGVPGPARDHVRAAVRSRSSAGITEPVMMEVLAGVRSERELWGAEQLLSAFTIVGVQPALDYPHAAQLYREVRRAGLTVRRMNDCLIAAVAQRRDLRLVHRDADFAAIAQVLPLRTLDLR